MCRSLWLALGARSPSGITGYLGPPRPARPTWAGFLLPAPFQHQGLGSAFDWPLAVRLFPTVPSQIRERMFTL